MKIIAFALLAGSAAILCGGASYLVSTTQEQRSNHKRRVWAKARSARQSVKEYFQTLFHTESPAPINTHSRAA